MWQSDQTLRKVPLLQRLILVPTMRNRTLGNISQILRLPTYHSYNALIFGMIVFFRFYNCLFCVFHYEKRKLKAQFMTTLGPIILVIESMFHS